MTRVRLPLLGALAALGLALAVPLVLRNAAQASPNNEPPQGAGTVRETVDAGGYTYLLVDFGGREEWIAGPQMTVAAGDPVTVPAGLLMEDFRSDKLDRTFDRIWFVDSVAAGTSSPHAGMSPHGSMGGGAMGSPGGNPHAGIGSGAAPEGVDLSGIQPLADGFTVEQIYAQGEKLAGGEVAFRGRVVKYLPGIMGRNWLHVRDGTGEAGANDLTVTTDAEASVGDLVVVKGKLAADRDFGSGYRYDLIVEEAQVTRQSES